MHEALQFLHQPATVFHAHVNAVAGERFGVVCAEGYRYWLKPALGCLLHPSIGDCVLISLSADQGFILMVLERSQALAAELRVPGDLQLNIGAGSLSVKARDGVSLDAGSGLIVDAENTIFTGRNVELDIHLLASHGARADSHWQERNERTEKHCQQVTLHDAQYGDSRRRVQGHEDVHTGSLRQRVDGDWSVRGETLDLFAEVAVAIDAPRIKLG